MAAPTEQERRAVARAIEKAVQGERLDFDEGVLLSENADFSELGAAADRIRRMRHGNRVFYRTDMNINYTNICVGGCGFCAFYRHKDGDGAYTVAVDTAREMARNAARLGVQEFHVVGGLNPEIGLEYFERLYAALREAAPGCHIQGPTAVEIDFTAKREGMMLPAALDRLQRAGLGSIPGGGAEIFNPEIRERMLASKIPATRWLEVHAEAHKLCIPTNATMLYGHVEEPVHRIAHMDALRKAQDNAIRNPQSAIRNPKSKIQNPKSPSGRFMAFVPLLYNPDNNELGRRLGLRRRGGLLDLRVAAVARLYLDNFEHIKLPWVTVGKDVALAALSFGTDDIGGASYGETILRAAGADTATREGMEDLPRLMEAAGFGVVRAYGDYSAIQNPKTAIRTGVRP